MQVRALKPGAVGLGMGGIAPGEILPSEHQILGIEAVPTAKPLLLTDGKDDGKASNEFRAVEAGVTSIAEHSAARHANVEESAAAAAATACVSERRAAADAATMSEYPTAAPSAAQGEAKPAP